MGKDSKDKKAKNVPKHVELRAAVALLHDTDKSGKVETALQLLHAVVSSTGGPYLGLAVADASSIKVSYFVPNHITGFQIMQWSLRPVSACYMTSDKNACHTGISFVRIPETMRGNTCMRRQVLLPSSYANTFLSTPCVVPSCLRRSACILPLSQVMDRALRSCTAMLKASSADDAAAAFAGDALDDLEVAGNRLRAVLLLAAVARAVNALLQRLSGARVDFNSSSLLEALLAAHTTCTLSTESLAAMAGQLSFPGSTAVLQVTGTSELPATAGTIVRQALVLHCLMERQTYLDMKLDAYGARSVLKRRTVWAEK